MLSAGINYGIKTNAKETAVDLAEEDRKLFKKALKEHQQNAQTYLRRRFREEEEQNRPSGEKQKK